MRIAILGPICRDTTIIGNRKHEHIGSIVYYTGLALANLGVEVTAFATYAEEDDAWVREHMPGVDVQHIPAEGTHAGVNTFDPENPRIRVCTVPYVRNVIEREDLPADLSSYDYLIIAPLLADHTPPTLIEKLGREGHTMIYGNFGLFTTLVDETYTPTHPENLLGLAKLFDYIFLDEAESMTVTGTQAADDAAKVLLQHGAKHVIITFGDEGSRYYDGATIIPIPAFPPKEFVDPTGAGDTYVAGFVNALELFSTPEERGRFAAMTATMKIEKIGAFDMSTQDVFERLKPLS